MKILFRNSFLGKVEFIERWRSIAVWICCCGAVKPAPYKAASSRRTPELRRYFFFQSTRIPKLLLSLLLALCIVVPSAVAQSLFVSETDFELTTSGDLNGDGLLDTVIVDKATGIYSVGFQNVSGAIVWDPPAHSGLSSVQGLGIGKLEDDIRDSLVFADAFSNRLNIVSFNGGASETQSIFVPSVGPHAATVVEIGGTNPDGGEDLVVGSSLNSIDPFTMSYLSNTPGGTFDTMRVDVASDIPTSRFNRVQLKPGSHDYFARVLQKNGVDEDAVEIFDPQEDGFKQVASLKNLTSPADYVHGSFGGGDSYQFVLYTPGKTELHAYETGNGAGLKSFSLEQSIYRVYVLEEAGKLALLVIFLDQKKASVFDFDGQALAERQLIEAESGVLFTGVLHGFDDAFHLLSGDPITKRSTTVDFYKNSGDKYLLNDRTDLAPRRQSPLGILTNVVVFDSDPLTSELAVPTQRLRFGDWSEGKSVVGKGIDVAFSNFVDPVSGLTPSGNESLLNSPPSVDQVLLNQVFEDTSTAMFSSTLGDVVSVLTVDPPSGDYPTAIYPIISSSNENVTLFYRASDASDWQETDGELPPFFSDVDLLYYARSFGGQATPIQTVRYRFPVQGDGMDSDLDGVPDFVELANGLHPVDSGNDSDLDGFSDLEELVAGSDPNDADSVPANPVLNPLSLVDLEITPLALSGVLGNDAVNQASLANDVVEPPVNGTLIQVNTPYGQLLGQGVVTESGGSNKAVIRNIPVSSDREFLVVSTAVNYWIENGDAGGADEFKGRELLCLIPMPRLDLNDFPMPPFTPGDANDWVAKARVRFQDLPRQTIQKTLTYKDSLSFLIFERLLNEVILLRAQTASASQLTLSPFRDSESPIAMSAATGFPGELLFAERGEFLSFYHGFPSDILDFIDPPQFGVDNGYDLQAIFAQIVAEVDSPPNGNIQALVDVAKEIYRVSALLANDSPGAYQSPFEELRAFLRFGGALSGAFNESDDDYASQVQGLDLPAASEGVFSLLSLLQPREVVSLLLQVDENTFATSCRGLRNLANDETVHLYDVNLNPFQFENTFSLLPGTELRVFGYTLDGERNNFLECADGAVEVVSVDLVRFPDLAIDSDENKNLLRDGWERLFGVTSPMDDDDGDGRSNLQELLDGTDPRDGTSGDSVVDLSPPHLEINQEPDGRFQLDWQGFPNNYESFFCVDVLYSGDLQVFDDADITRNLSDRNVMLPENFFEDNGIENRGFVTLRLRLKE